MENMSNKYFSQKKINGAICILTQNWRIQKTGGILTKKGNNRINFGKLLYDYLFFDKW